MKRDSVKQKLRIGLLLVGAFPCLATWNSAGLAFAQAVTDAHSQQFFEEHIHKVLIAKCYECHSRQAAEIEGGLLLDSRNALRSGGDSGPAVVPGKPQESLLFHAITAKEDAMPPGKPLSREEIDDFQKWILAGATDPREQTDAPELSEPDFSKDRDYWAFRPLPEVDIPEVRDRQWPRDTLDYFMLSAMESNQLRPALVSQPATLVRRVTFDLLGLPPTPEAVAKFTSNPTEQAYRDLVDELLQRPEYGERWAQHWLDVVRYAETEGFEYDRTLPDMWRYRDYVIDSFNSDKPYDQFLFEQLAGDEVAAQLPNDQQAELRIATGFFRLGAVRRNAGNQQVASSRNEVLTERTDIIGSAILGLTIGCARCHDHKFDPLSQRDYYRLQAFMAASQEVNRSLRNNAEQARLLALKAELEDRIGVLKEQIANLDGDEEERVKAEITELEDQIPSSGPTICGVENSTQDLQPIHVLRRGDPDLPGDVVLPRLPAVLCGRQMSEIAHDVANPRTQLTQWLLREQSALLARVFVNRIWQGHFGTGLVSTANDFGKNGSGVSHPELLDHLSNRFVESGWRVKELHRAILLSATYRQSSQPHDAVRTQQLDPNNRWLSYFPKRRLSSEELRDAMLAVAGRLNPTMGGESVMLPVEQQLIDQLYSPTSWAVSPEPEQHVRRSIYLFAKRNLRIPFMEVFDQPAAQTSCAVREQSTHARQALELLNGVTTNELAESFAQRLQKAAGQNHDQTINTAFRLVASRNPTARERELARDFLESVGVREFALAMFNINAFLYVD